jgi:iron complex transport system ATP-binding protein
MQDGKVMARGEIGMTLTSASISEAFNHPLTLNYQNQRFSAVSS